MLVLHDPATLLHRTVELLGAKLIPALESPERITAILEALEESHHDIRSVDFRSAGEETKALLAQLLSASHDAGYLEHLQSAHRKWVSDGLIEEDDSLLPECFRFPNGATGSRTVEPPKDVFARAGYYAFDMSSGICRDTWTSIEASAFLAIEASRLIAASPSEEEREKGGKSVFALCRPPGHHCTTSMAGGYCYVNNAVVAVHALRYFFVAGEGQRSGKPKIAILDIDFHHGNGTQDYFYTDPSVLYVSIHGKDEYPYYSGFEEEGGAEAGVSFNLNYPLEPGASMEQYLSTLDTSLEEISRFKPDFLLVSLGFDTFSLDPLGSFKIETGDYTTIGERIRDAEGLRQIPGAILLEGGYVLDRLGRNLLAFLEGWEGAEARKG